MTSQSHAELRMVRDGLQQLVHFSSAQQKLSRVFPMQCLRTPQRRFHQLKVRRTQAVSEDTTRVLQCYEMLNCTECLLQCTTIARVILAKTSQKHRTDNPMQRNETRSDCHHLYPNKRTRVCMEAYGHNSSHPRSNQVREACTASWLHSRFHQVVTTLGFCYAGDL